MMMSQGAEVRFFLLTKGKRKRGLLGYFTGRSSGRHGDDLKESVQSGPKAACEKAQSEKKAICEKQVKVTERGLELRRE